MTRLIMHCYRDCIQGSELKEAEARAAYISGASGRSYLQPRLPG